MKKAVIFLFALILLNFSLVGAAKDVQIIEPGIIVEYPKLDLIPQGQDFLFHFHTFNATSGNNIDNSSTTCSFHLYDPRGKHITEYNYNVEMTSNLIDWEVNVSYTNFTEIGDYSYIFQCNSTVAKGHIGGAASVPIRVSSSSTTSTTSEAIFYLLMTLIIFFLFLILAFITYWLPYSNKRNENNEIAIIPKLKYVKLGLIPVTYALFIWLLNLLVGISDNYMSLNMYYGLISFLFYLFIRLSYPLFIFVIIIAGYNLIKDIELNKQIKKFGSAKYG